MIRLVKSVTVILNTLNRMLNSLDKVKFAFSRTGIKILKGKKYLKLKGNLKIPPVKKHFKLFKGPNKFLPNK